MLCTSVSVLLVLPELVGLFQRVGLLAETPVYRIRKPWIQLENHEGRIRSGFLLHSEIQRAPLPSLKKHWSLFGGIKVQRHILVIN